MNILKQNQINKIEKDLKAIDNKKYELEVEILQKVIQMAKQYLIFEPVIKFKELKDVIQEGEFFVNKQEEYFISENGQILKGALLFSKDYSEESVIGGGWYHDVFLLEDGSLKLFNYSSEFHLLRNGLIIERFGRSVLEEQAVDQFPIMEIINSILVKLKEEG